MHGDEKLHPVYVLNCVDTLVFITIVMWKGNRVESINPPNTD